MLKFVREGRVVFTERDNGELVFSDKALERAFIEKASQVTPDAETTTEMTAPQAKERLEALLQQLATDDPQRAQAESLLARLNTLEG